MSWRFYINTENGGGGKYYAFKTFKVYWAYRWYIAEQIDFRCNFKKYEPKSPKLKKALGSVFIENKNKYEKTNYSEHYAYDYVVRCN